VGAAIEICNVTKTFRLYHEHYTSLKERVVHFGRIPYEPFLALHDIDFDVEQGATVGILGHNGSGKSTLLKCVAGILQPSTGEIRTHGRVAALLELGAGFNPELTGRENIFLNASILGLAKRDTAKVFDEIVAFAELERFIDMQVRHYSSGMYVRLGFAVAVNVDPDILLVDEVLSVGDEAFQRKCLDRVAKFQREGRTILFVTHAADLVRRICDRAVVLDHGEMVVDAPPGEAVRTFRETLQAAPQFIEDVPVAESAEGALPEDRASVATHRVKMTNVSIDHPGLLVDRNYLLPDESMTVRIAYHAALPTDDLLFGIAIYDQNGDHLFGTNTKIEGVDVPPAEGDGEITFEFDHVPLLDGTYLVTLAIQSFDEGTVYDWREQQHHFSVMNPSRAVGLVSFPLEVRFADSVHGSTPAPPPIRSDPPVSPTESRLNTPSASDTGAQ
jgi:ABC-type polysaccharide/polyol phosphate transport system ATPase subunit